MAGSCGTWASMSIARRWWTSGPPAPMTSSATGPIGTDPYPGGRFGPCRGGGADGGRRHADHQAHSGARPRRAVDSHLELPRVDTDFDTLAETDFVPFRALNDIPWAMTAHIVYSTVWMPTQPATLSPTVIAEVIRGEIGFAGLLLSDDLSMKALKGSLDDACRQRSLAAGCDVVLHCNGDMAEMAQVVRGAKPLSAVGLARYEQGQRRLNADPDPDQADLAEELSALMA